MEPLWFAGKYFLSGDDETDAAVSLVPERSPAREARRAPQLQLQQQQQPAVDFFHREFTISFFLTSRSPSYITHSMKDSELALLHVCMSDWQSLLVLCVKFTAPPSPKRGLFSFL